MKATFRLSLALGLAAVLILVAITPMVAASFPDSTSYLVAGPEYGQPPSPTSSSGLETLARLKTGPSLGEPEAYPELLPASVVEPGQTGHNSSIVKTGSITPTTPSGDLEAQANLAVVKSANTESSTDGSTVTNGERITYTIKITNLAGTNINVSIVNDDLAPVTFFDVKCVSGPNCTLVQTVVITEREISTIKSEDPFTIPIAITVTEAITWGNFTLGPGTSETLQFSARIDCKPDGASILNSADVVFGTTDPSGNLATSNQTNTLMKFVPVPESAIGQPVLLGPTGCTEEIGAYDQDWGDYDRDGDLDLALGTIDRTTIYRNNGGSLAPRKTYLDRRTFGVRWANLDNDEGLELIGVGESEPGLTRLNGLNFIYDPDANFAETEFQTEEVLWRADVTDYDKDGQLELVGASYIDASAASDYKPCRLRTYDFVGGSFVPNECLIGPLPRDNNPIFFPSGDDDTYSLEWGNTTDTPFLDLIEGNFGTFDRRYVNNGFVLSSIGNGVDFENDDTTSVDLGDFDNDGDLDLAVGNYNQPNLLYRRDQLDPPVWTSVWSPAETLPTNAVAWGNQAVPSRDRSLPVFDDRGLTYELPFEFPFGPNSATRNIQRIHVNTNGLIELLQAGESCRECNSYYTHLFGRHIFNNIDAIFAANDDLITGFIIEALPEGAPNRVEITWMGAQYYTIDFTTRPMLFKVILYENGDIRWKFFDMLQDPWRHVFSGVYDEVANWEYSIGGFGGPPLQPGGTSPRGFNVNQTYLFDSSSPGITLDTWPDSAVATPSSIATADNNSITYPFSTLPNGPFSIDYFTRTIQSVNINTNGLIQLFETGESCAGPQPVAPCSPADASTHTKAISQEIDAVYAFNSNLKTGVTVEHVRFSPVLTSPNDHVLITWMGTTSADNNFWSRGLAYNVRLFRDGRVRWKFFDMNFTAAAEDRFSGLFDAGTKTEYPVPDYDKLVGNQIYRAFQFDPLNLTITPFTPQKLVLAVGTVGKNFIYTATGTSLASAGLDISQDVYTTTSLAWGDFDGDGLQDLAVGNYNGPNQIFQADSGEPTGLNPIAAWTSDEVEATRSLAWSDYDRDGDLDLAVGNTLSQPNRIYRNDSTGTSIIFSLAWTSVETDSTWSVAWGDYDNDGDPDLAVGNYGQQNRIYPNENGLILHEPVWTSFHASNTRVLAWADYDLDGDLDLVAGNNGLNELFINRLKFRSGGINPVINNLGVINDISWADYNNDGWPDLAFGGSDLETPGGGYVNAIENVAGQVELIEANLVRIGQDDDFEIFDVAWGDYNRDGYLDMAASFPRTRQVRLFKSFGAGLVWMPDQILDNVQVYSIDWADVQADGWPDLVVADSADTAGPEVRLYPNDNGFFNFSTSDGYVASSQLVPGVVVNVRAVDRDNDGDLDLSMVNLGEQSQQLTTFGSFLNSNLTPVASPFRSNSVAWGDHDGDGFQDLLFGGSGFGVPTRLYHNQNGVNFCRAGVPGCPVEEPGGGFSSGGRRQAIFGDVDNDGKLDIADGVPGGSIQLYLSSNEVTAPPLVREGDADTLAWGDVDGDGLLDLLIGGSQDFASPHEAFINQAVSPYIGEAADWSSVETDNTVSLAWADYDDDNYLDFAASNCSIGGASNIQLYRNNGDSSNFTLVTNTGLPTSTNCISSLAWADYDGDGDYDLAAGVRGGRTYLYGYQQSSGTFTQAWVSNLDRNTVSLAWGDWNSDGKPDLALGNRGQPDQVYGNFSSPGNSALLRLWESDNVLDTTAVAWGDKDNDGDLDLAVSQDGTVSNGYYENGYAAPAHLGNSDFTKYMPLPDSPPYLSIPRPDTEDAYLISSPALDNPVLTLTFTVFDPDGSRQSGSNAAGDDILTGKTLYEYSVNGGGTWLPATVSGTISISPTTFRQGQVNTFPWDVERDGIVSDDALFRVTVVGDRSTSPIQRTTSRAVSPPFRVRGGLTCSWPANATIVPSINGITPTYQINAGSPLRFDGLVSLIGPRDTVLTYTWNFGDGSNPVIGPVFTSHTYTQSNRLFTVTLNIIGEPCPEIRMASASTQITVGSIFTESLFLPIVTRNFTGTTSVTDLTFDPNVPLPNQLTGVRGQSQPGGTTVTWQPGQPEDNILEYHIYRRSRAAIGPFRRIGATPAGTSRYVDRTADCGYMYFVTALNAGGESLPSTSVFVSRLCR